jgi:hypothetical protein
MRRQATWSAGTVELTLRDDGGRRLNIPDADAGASATRDGAC